MGIEERVRELVQSALAGLVGEGTLPPGVLDASYAVERPKRAEHGDLATNVALVVQKAAKKPPREIAGLLQARLQAAPEVRAVEIAGAGFLNVRLAPGPFNAVLAEVLA
jgi:arginyl-tRNA synthetase